MDYTISQELKKLKDLREDLECNNFLEPDIQEEYLQQIEEQIYQKEAQLQYLKDSWIYLYD